MGILAPISSDILRRRRETLWKDTERLWRCYFNEFPTLPRYRIDAKYVVGVDTIINEGGNNVWVSDIQDFYPGQEIELLSHVEYIATEFGTTHIFVCIKDSTGFIENSVTVGDVLC